MGFAGVYFSEMHGVLVTRVLAGSPAAKGGIRVGDVVTHIDNQPVTNSIRLQVINVYIGTSTSSQGGGGKFQQLSANLSSGSLYCHSKEKRAKAAIITTTLELFKVWMPLKPPRGYWRARRSNDSQELPCLSGVSEL